MKSNRIRLSATLAALVAVCDQLSKGWVVNMLMKPPREVPVTDFFSLVLVWNKGVTFGLFNHMAPSVMPIILLGAAVLILLFLARWLWRTTSVLVSLCLAAIMGGAVGNIIDRLQYGAVVDFLDFHIGTYHWYAFNIADAAIVTGLTLLILESVIRGK
jgi:signal peptidase II